MSLSDYEKQVLAQLESQLRDPEAGISESLTESESKRQAGNFSPRVIAMMIIVLLAGLSILVGGVAQGYTVFGVFTGVLGFAVMLFGVSLPWTSIFKSDVRNTRPQFSFGRGAKTTSGFMDRQRDRWDRRMDQRGH